MECVHVCVHACVEQMWSVHVCVRACMCVHILVQMEFSFSPRRHKRDESVKAGVKTPLCRDKVQPQRTLTTEELWTIPLTT